MDLILFGAGRVGEKFVKSNAFNEIRKCYNNIMFWDNNRALVGTKIENIEVVDLDSSIKEADIIVTSGFWVEIYRMCLQYGVNSVRIYDEECDDIYEYKEMCLNRKFLYKNDKFIKYERENQQKIAEGIEKFHNGGNLFESMVEVAIGLSNLCNYAFMHKKCPASYIESKEIMPSKLVYKILDELAEANWGGQFVFNCIMNP